MLLILIMNSKKVKQRRLQIIIITGASVVNADNDDKRMRMVRELNNKLMGKQLIIPPYFK